LFNKEGGEMRRIKRTAFLLMALLMLLGCYSKLKPVVLAEPKAEEPKVEKPQKSQNLTQEELESIPIWPKCSLQTKYTASINSDFILNWYNSNLAAMNEPSIGFKNDCEKCYRFIWLRTFHHPIIVSFFKYPENAKITWKILDGLGGYYPGKIMLEKERELTIEEWNKVEQIIDDMEFWRLYLENKYHTGMDGAEWIIEGKCEESYHIVIRWSPEESNSFRQGCLKLLGYTDIQIPEQEIY
jgi:hypothetical protein